MKEHSELFIGLDVSKLKTSVASAEDGREGEFRFFGDIDASPASVAALAKKLAKRGGGGWTFVTRPGRQGMTFTGTSLRWAMIARWWRRR
jgi:hypothetical protein